MKKYLLKKYQPLALSIALVATPIHSYAASQESIDLAQQMYVAYYGRPGDPGGWAWWADKFDESSNLNDALEAFGNSQEYYDSFGDLSNEQLITNLYQQLFNRDPDAGGLAFYAGWLSEGKSTLASIAKQVADGAQNSDATILNNKVQVANYFTDKIETLSASYISDDIPSVQYILSQIDDTTESVTSAQNLISSWIPSRDLDSDGVADALDTFPYDATETTDSDNDGTGDNADAFPNDASETVDSDGDGTGDNADVFPNDTSETIDSDGDGTGDNADAFPNDASETVDSDGDGTGDNADDFPNDSSETIDSDGDGIGDNADPFPNDADQNTTAQTYPIVDTNQTQCFNSSTGNATNCTGSGMDADYAGNQPSYTVSDDELTVTDNVTGIIWSKSPDTNGDNIIDVDDKMTQSEAVSYCANLTLSNQNDWRLPDIKTAYSLIDFSGKDPSGYNGTDTSELTPFLNTAFTLAFGDTNAGERIIDAQYATTSIYVSTTMLGDTTMFGVNLVDGRIKGYPINGKTFYVHCARGNEDYGINNFTNNEDQTISDNATGLMWQQNDISSTNWEDAINSCETASTANHTDWRLPNAKELQSIVDYSRSPDTSNSAAIDPIFNATSITNEEGEIDWPSYWASTTHQNYTDDGSSATYLVFGRALGYMNNNFLDVHGAGAQRSDDKVSPTAVHGFNTGTDNNGDTFYYHGPQGDILRANHQVRCVRSLEN